MERMKNTMILAGERKKERPLALNHNRGPARVGSKGKKLMKILVIISTVYGHFQITKYETVEEKKIFQKIQFNLTI